MDKTPIVSLPWPLPWRPTPNQSARRSPVHLVVVHRPVGGFVGSVAWLCDPRSQASAHVVTNGRDAVQLVSWSRKAWSCVALNSVSDNIEVDDRAWLTRPQRDEVALQVAARIVAYRCHVRGIPPVWTHNAARAGVCRHFDLGLAGGGHSDPTTDSALWAYFMDKVRHEYDRGGFRQEWGR